MTTPEPMPTHRLREILRRQADRIISGRATFERLQLNGNPSDKPLPKVEVHPELMLQLLDHIDHLEAEKEARHAMALDA